MLPSSALCPKAKQSPTTYYTVVGELFFASSNDLTTRFRDADDPDQIIIDMSGSHVWDASTVAALDSIANKHEHHSKRVVLIGMNEASANFHTRFAGTLGAGR